MLPPNAFLRHATASFHFQDAKESFEYLKALKQEIKHRAQGSDTKQQLEVEEVWDDLRRDLRFEDEPAGENMTTALEGGAVEGKKKSKDAK